jgi:Spy/CpxP family protein refolding chaperone
MGTLLAGLTFAQAQNAPAKPNWQNHQNQTHSGQQKGFGQHGRMFAKLNLTAGQKDRAKAIFSQARETAKPVREQLQQNRVAMAAAVKAGEQGRVAHLNAQRGVLMAKLAGIRSESMAKFSRELTPAQRATLKTEGFGARANRNGSNRGAGGNGFRGFRG